MIITRNTKNESNLLRLLWLIEDYTKLMSKCGYFDYKWDIYMKRQVSIQTYILTNYTEK